MTPRPPLSQQCSSCTGRAIFATPYGRLCLHHTLKQMKSDGNPWMPKTIEDPKRLQTDRQSA